jgi:DNA-binding beta-propeller fold protein YncE
MKFGNFSGGNTNFLGGFFGDNPAILFNPSTYKFAGRFSVLGGVPNETSPTGIWFKPDGTKVFFTGQASARIKSLDLSTPWDITTCSNLQSCGATLADTAGVALTAPSSCAFSDDGTKLFITDSTVGNGSIYRYNLPVAWDVTSIVVTTNCNADQQNNTFLSGNTRGTGIYVKPDGLLIAVSNSAAPAGYRVGILSAANDLTTITLDSSASSTGVVGINFFNNGNNVSVNTGSFLEVYGCPTPFSLTSISLQYRKFVFENFEGSLLDLFWKPDGTSFYVIGNGATIDAIYQYNLYGI